MSNRTLVELNHDYRPADDAALLAWARAMQTYLGSGDPDDLPPGVTFKHRRHHSEPCPLDLATRDGQRIAGLLRQETAMREITAHTDAMLHGRSPVARHVVRNSVSIEVTHLRLPPPREGDAWNGSIVLNGKRIDVTWRPNTRRWEIVGTEDSE